MKENIKELEDLAEFISITIAKKREALAQYVKAYDKSISISAAETVQNLLLHLKKQEEENIIKLRMQLHELKMEIMLARGPRRITKSIIIKATPQELYRRSARIARLHANEIGIAELTQPELELRYENERVVWRTISGDTAMFGTINLKPVEEGTELTYTINYEDSYSILRKAFYKMKTVKDLAQSMSEALQNLKNQVEKVDHEV